jgi:hypothetical protein
MARRRRFRPPFLDLSPTACAQRMSGEPASFSVRRRRRDRAALTRSLDPTLAEPYSVPPHATLAAPHPANSKYGRSCRGGGASCPSFAYPGAAWRPSSRRRRTPRRATAHCRHRSRFRVRRPFAQRADSDQILPMPELKMGQLEPLVLGPFIGAACEVVRLSEMATGGLLSFGSLAESGHLMRGAGGRGGRSGG